MYIDRARFVLKLFTYYGLVACFYNPVQTVFPNKFYFYVISPKLSVLCEKQRAIYVCWTFLPYAINLRPFFGACRNKNARFNNSTSRLSNKMYKSRFLIGKAPNPFRAPQEIISEVISIISRIYF